MFNNPEMMKAAQNMMSNMKPEEMQRMSQMAAGMDPKVMQNMMNSMGGNMSGVDATQAIDQMKNMSPEQLTQGMQQAQTQMGAQKQYMMNAAEMLKKEGNAAVAKEDYKEALSKYQRAVDNLDSHVGADVNALQIGLLNNSALCHLKLKSFDKALEAGEKALKVDPRSFKGLFRRGQAKEGLGKLAPAVTDMRRALEISPGDKAISRELDRLRAELEAQGIEEEDYTAAPLEVKSEWQAPSTTSGSRATSSTSSAGASNSSEHWAKAAEKIAENPDMLAQATETMSKMTPEQLQTMMSSTPLPPGVDAETMKSQMENLQKNPEMLKNAMECLKSMPEDERKKKLLAQQGAAAGASASGGAAPSAAAAASMFENPDMMKQAMSMAQNMSDDDLTKMGISNPGEADMMKKAAEQMASNPDMMKQVSDMMKNMDPAQMESMMKMSAGMRGGGGMPGMPGMPGGADGEGGMPDASAFLNNPEMMKATEDMMKNMSPEMLSSMAKASGVDLSEDKAKMVARFLPYMLKLFKVFTYLKRAWSAMWSARGRMVLAAVVILLAMWQHFRS